MTDEEKQAIIKAKQLAQNILDSFKKIEKHTKKSKQSRKAFKVLQEFINCHLDSPSIMKKYFLVIHLIKGINS